MSDAGRPGDAVDFLRWLRPGGPWVLTSIPPEGGRTSTATFSEADAEALLKWLSDRDGRENLYFTVNRTRTALTSKASKEDIGEVEFLHVDVDPRKPHPDASAAELARHNAAERARILPLLEAFRPPPSAIIDSGGGYQGFWRLDEPIYLGGDVGRAADAEAYNQQLDILLSGDASTFNIDRIMRLPGTTNLPNARKRAKGRVERVAEAVYLAPAGERTYPLSEFLAAPRVQTNGGSATGPKVKISGNVRRLANLDELPDRVSPRTRMLIVQGEDPDDLTRYGSRSEIVWAVLCELLRSGTDDDTIAAVLLDPDFAISAHVLAQKRPIEYVARQIQRAREEVEEPMLRTLNERHAVISDLGGKCRIISEVLDSSLERPRLRISKQSFDDFRNRYMNVRVQVGTTQEGAAVYKPAGGWWLSHPLRRQYDSLIFSPGRDVEGAYNLWKGFACEALPGRNHEPYLAHLRDNVCSGNAAHYEYLIRWMARAVQRPAEPGQVAVVLRGGMGAGKGTVAQAFGSLWGRHFLHISTAKHLVGQFNAHLRDCVFLYADEAFFAGDKQHESTLRTLITEDTLSVESKGVDMEIGPNYVHLVMASNSSWVVPAGADERRFFVLDVSEARKQDTAYFRAISAKMDAGGRESLLHFLMSLDLSDFEVRMVPQTEALREQKMLSLRPEEEWWLERLMDGRITRNSASWATEVQKTTLHSDYLAYAEGQRIFRRASPSALGKFLARVMPVPFPASIQRMTDVSSRDDYGTETWRRERVYFYTVPDLESCRAEWDRRYGGPYAWPVDVAPEESLRRGLEDREMPY
jgi:hypothetical protein